MAHLIGQAIGGLIHFALLLFDWVGGVVQNWNDKVFKWAYDKFGWEEFDGEEEE